MFPAIFGLHTDLLRFFLPVFFKGSYCTTNKFGNDAQKLCQGCFQQISCQRLDLLGIYCHRSLRLQGTAGWKDGLRWWICSVFWKTFCENWRIDNLLVQQYATVMTCLFLDMSLQLCEIQLQQADEMQGASSKLAIRIFYGLVPCILGALSAMVIFFLCPHLSNKSRLWKLLIWKLKRSKDLHQAGNYW